MENNIFEAAGKQPKKRPSEKKGAKVIATAKVQATSEELDAMLNQMREIRENLENQLAAIYQKGKESNIDMSQFPDNAYALTAKEIEKVQQKELELREKINAITPPESCIRKVPKSKEKMTKERKGKMRGARQKWIPIP